MPMSPAPRSTRPHAAGAPDSYFTLGFESYVAGRHATFMGFVEVAANLFHVGVELILKAELLRPASVTMENCLDQARGELMSRLGTRYDPDSDRLDPNVVDACRQPYNARAKELQDKYVHSLPRLWTAVKATLAKPDLDKFDPLITQLHQWEDIRYPTHVRSRSIAMSFNPRKGQINRARTRGELLNRYALSREAIDELVATLIIARGWNPKWVRLHAGSRGVGADGLDTYLRDNQHAVGS